MNQESARPVFIHAEIGSATGEPITSYLLPLNRPITIDDDNYSATLQQFYVARLTTGGGAERKHPGKLMIKGLGGSEPVRHRDQPVNPTFTCMVPSLSKEVHTRVPMLPPAAGIFHHLEISVHDMNNEAIRFRHLILTIKIIPNHLSLV